MLLNFSNLFLNFFGACLVRLDPLRAAEVLGEEEDAGIGVCGWLLTSFSMLLVLITLPFSLCVCFKVRPLPTNRLVRLE